MFLILSSLLLVQDQIQHIETELGKVQTHLAELGLSVVTEHMASMSPEGGDRLANDRIVWRGVAVDEASVVDLALGSGVDAMNLGVGELFEFLRDTVVRRGAW